MNEEQVVLGDWQHFWSVRKVLCIDLIMATTADGRQSLVVGFLSGAALTLGVLYITLRRRRDHGKHSPRSAEIVDGVDGLIGNTPLMRIRSLSEATGCTILVSSRSIFPVKQVVVV